MAIHAVIRDSSPQWLVSPEKLFTADPISGPVSPRRIIGNCDRLSGDPRSFMQIVTSSEKRASALDVHVSAITSHNSLCAARRVLTSMDRMRPSLWKSSILFILSIDVPKKFFGCGPAALCTRSHRPADRVPGSGPPLVRWNGGLGSRALMPIRIPPRLAIMPLFQ